MIIPFSHTVNRTSNAYHRMTQAGFIIDEIMQIAGTRRISCRFTCVCGRIEEVMVEADATFMELYSYGDRVDIAQLLENCGAVSVEHLRQDGYTEDQIKEIRKSYA